MRVYFYKINKRKKKYQFDNVRLKNNNYYLRKHSSQFLFPTHCFMYLFLNFFKHIKSSPSKKTTETVNWILEVVWSYLERFSLIQTWLNFNTHLYQGNKCLQRYFFFHEIPHSHELIRWAWFAWQESIMKPYLVMKPAEMNHSSLCNILFSSYSTLIFIHRVALPPRHFCTYLICPCSIPLRQTRAVITNSV